LLALRVYFAKTGHLCDGQLMNEGK